MITERNYLEVYPYDTWNAKTIPVLIVDVNVDIACDLYCLFS